jgi:hypothetical protein
MWLLFLACSPTGSRDGAHLNSFAPISQITKVLCVLKGFLSGAEGGGLHMSLVRHNPLFPNHLSRYGQSLKDAGYW